MNDWRSISRRFGAARDDLTKAAANALEEMVDELMDKAASKWADVQWYVFSPDEVDCTVQLYRWMQEVVEHPDFSILSVRLEAIQVAPEVLRGEASAKSMRRPDLEVTLGRSIILIECKRLSKPSGHPRKYVYEGLDRFVSGGYAAVPFGVMVGYLQGSDSVAIYEAINKAIDSHPKMDPTHRLVQLAPMPTISWRYQSVHTRPSHPDVRIKHLHLDMPARALPA